jgi:hypothetical protein
MRRNCGHCGAFLPPFAPQGQKFCGEQCRVWAQQKREALSGPTVLALAAMRSWKAKAVRGGSVREQVTIVEAEVQSQQLPGLQLKPKAQPQRQYFEGPPRYLTPPEREKIHHFDLPTYLPATPPHRTGIYGTRIFSDRGVDLELYRQALALLTWEQEVVRGHCFRYYGYDWRAGEFTSIDELD